MSSQLQIGPKSRAVRAAVRMNGLNHGLTAETLVFAGESRTDFESLLASLEDEYEPATPTEAVLVSHLAMAAWRLNRGFHAEASFLAKRLLDTKDVADKEYTNVNSSDRLAIAIDRSHSDLNNLSRYEARLERSFHKALQQLQRLRKQRLAEMQNQSQFPDQPPPPEPRTEPEPVQIEPSSGPVFAVAKPTRTPLLNSEPETEAEPADLPAPESIDRL